MSCRQDSFLFLIIILNLYPERVGYKGESCSVHYPLIIEVNDLGKMEEIENMEMIFQSIRQPWLPKSVSLDWQK